MKRSLLLLPLLVLMVQLTVAQTNPTAQWLGVIGNSSSSFTNQGHIWKGFDFHEMSCSSAACYVTYGYNEGLPGSAAFLISQPQTPSPCTVPDFQTRFEHVATDGNTIYMAQTGDTDDNNATPYSFVEAFRTDCTQLGFTNGLTVNPTPTDRTYLRVIDWTPTAQKTNKATGIAVQLNGNLLAVSHAGLNNISLFDKVTGSLLGTIVVNAPGQSAFDATGNLWVVTGTVVQQFTGLPSAPVAGVTLSLTAPLSVATLPNGNILVADGGMSQQVFGFTPTGTKVLTLGLPGGYRSNGPAVTPNKFMFLSAIRNAFTFPRAFLAAQTDGTFWVGDGGNVRILHYAGDGTYLEQISMVGDNQHAAIDPQSPSRIFGYNFLEWKYNFAGLAPGTGWSLVNNWASGPAFDYLYSSKAGQYQNIVYSQMLYVRDLAGCTPGAYSFVYGGNGSAGVGRWAVAYLSTDGTDAKFLIPAGGNNPAARFQPDNNGNLTVLAGPANGVQTASILPFQGCISGIPTWGTSTLATTLPAVKTHDPGIQFATYGLQFDPILSQFIFFDAQSGSTDTGFHFGVAPAGASAYSWLAAPVASQPTPDGKGDYPQANAFGGLNGNNAIAIPSLGVYGWNYNGQYANFSNQTVLYDHTGKFLIQFGAAANPGGATAGYAGNYFNMDCAAYTDGNIYCVSGDESVHAGVHVWQITMPPVGPVISNITTANTPLGSNTTNVHIAWTTSVQCTNHIESGPTTAYGWNTPLSYYTNWNLVEYPGTYHFRIVSTDAKGNTTTSPDSTFVVN
jgi:hypothetical protein